MNNREIEKNEALARIKGLENELANGWQRDRIKALEDRVAQLEAALRKVRVHVYDIHALHWIDAALDQSSPPTASP